LLVFKEILQKSLLYWILKCWNIKSQWICYFHIKYSPTISISPSYTEAESMNDVWVEVHIKNAVLLTSDAFIWKHKWKCRNFSLHFVLWGASTAGWKWQGIRTRNSITVGADKTIDIHGPAFCRRSIVSSLMDTAGHPWTPFRGQSGIPLMIHFAFQSNVPIF
jgi:hypothetical protein